MKKTLLIIGILLIIAAILFLLLAGLFLHSYHSLRDGTPEHYAALQQKAIVFGAIGVVLALGGAACLIFRTRI